MEIDILIIIAISGFAGWKTYEIIWWKSGNDLLPFVVGFAVWVGGGMLLSYLWGCLAGFNPSC